MDMTTIVFALIILVSFILTNMISNRFIKYKDSTGLFLLTRVGIFIGIYLVLFGVYYLIFLT
ncbi:hypothetical protein [Staphylococcus carnosus]|uniref:Uncharacterized protein n=2 Tax=Staphylococcus carnosus TaxID=1281 RepID=B9DJP3_STACT|nr:hypothetical protein [Staphylococcus carnosus]ANZ32346.1 hypothetical protein BEK99_00015 [Staphylococcus carnosus]KKB25712.1 hypothetical protein VV61_03690 [Staphylococcus carnosus]KOR13199.1 hypothetical protein AMC75_08200 [Staphylococcus carnosus]POA01977.1 hypothetical protein CD153_07170 [Staphylococcus carnosus]QPT02896.1 hypothetical protein I6G40_07110 [Staphylococcus carnosus]